MRTKIQTIEDEIKQYEGRILKLKEELITIQYQCPHPTVFNCYDENDERHCGLCGCNIESKEVPVDV